MPLNPRDLALPERFSSFRPGQSELALSLLASDHTRHLLSAPPGSGKTLTYVTYALLAGLRTLVLVANKGLESQLLDDFSGIDMAGIRGHTNYPCAQTSFTGDGSGDGEDMELECTARKSGRECAYWDRAVPAVLSSRLATTNYAHWVQCAKSDDPGRLGHFDLLVLDEAHRVLDLLTDYLTTTIRSRAIDRYLGIGMPERDTADEWITWLGEAVSQARIAYLAAKRMAATSGQDGADKEQARIERLGKTLAWLHRAMTDRPDNWVFQRSRSGPPRNLSRSRSEGDGSGPPEDVRVKVSPVWCTPYVGEFLYRDIPNILLCSGTLSPQTGVYLGIPEEESDYLEAASSFPPSARPFIYVSSYPPLKVDKNIDEGGLRRWVNLIDETVMGRMDRNGLIHSRSYSRARQIMERSRVRERSGISVLTTHNGSEELREAVLSFKRDSLRPPRVLVSPSIDTGYDFPGAEAMYQIVAKVPFLDSRDPITKARMASDKMYQNHVVAQTIVQTVGRINRSADHVKETFIFDWHWTWFARQYRKLFARWFRDAWRWEGKIPTPPALDARPRRVLSGR